MRNAQSQSRATTFTFMRIRAGIAGRFVPYPQHSNGIAEVLRVLFLVPEPEDGHFDAIEVLQFTEGWLDGVEVQGRNPMLVPQISRGSEDQSIVPAEVARVGCLDGKWDSRIVTESVLAMQFKSTKANEPSPESFASPTLLLPPYLDHVGDFLGAVRPRAVE